MNSWQIPITSNQCVLQYLPVPFIVSTPDLVKSANFIHVLKKKKLKIVDLCKACNETSVNEDKTRKTKVKKKKIIIIKRGPKSLFL
jgi:hypothetical protein